MTADETPTQAFKKGMDAGRTAALRIVTHPNASAILARHREDFVAAVPPECAPDQSAVTDLGLAIGSWPDRSGWLRPAGVLPLRPGEPPPVQGICVDPKDPRKSSGPWSAGWPELPEADRAKRHVYVGKLRGIVAAIALELVEAGVPVDPGAVLDLCILVQLLLLDIDLAAKPDVIVSKLNLLPPYSVARTGRHLTNTRDDWSREVRNAADSVRQWLRAEQPDYRGNELRDKGGRPAGASTRGSDSEALREHLPKVLSAHPKATAEAIRTGWKLSTPGSAGLMLREAMGRRIGDAPPPSRSLERAIAEVRKTRQ